MAFTNRLLASLVGGSIVALICAATLLRWLSGNPDDAMSAAGMLLMIVWPILVVLAFVPGSGRTAWGIIFGVGMVATAIGWAAP